MRRVKASDKSCGRWCHWHSLLLSAWCAFALIGCALNYEPPNSRFGCRADCESCDEDSIPPVCRDADGPMSPAMACDDAPECGPNEYRNPSTCECECGDGYRWFEGPVGVRECVVSQSCADGITCPLPGAVCENDASLRDGYLCRCPEGWMETGSECVEPPPPDVCMGVSCPTNSDCIDEGGVAACSCFGELRLSSSGARCECPEGTLQDGVSCLTCDDFVCGSNEICMDPASGCECVEGFRPNPDGPGCVELCYDVMCGGLFESCMPETGACDCEEGYRLDGMSCVPTGPFFFLPKREFSGDLEARWRSLPMGTHAPASPGDVGAMFSVAARDRIYFIPATMSAARSGASYLVWQFQPSMNRWLAPVILSGRVGTTWSGVYGSTGSLRVVSAYYVPGPDRVTVTSVDSSSSSGALAQQFTSFPTPTPFRLNISLPGTRRCISGGATGGCAGRFPEAEYDQLRAEWFDLDNVVDWAERDYLPDSRLSACRSHHSYSRRVTQHVARLGPDELGRETVFVEDTGYESCTGPVGRTSYGGFGPFRSSYSGDLAARNVRGATLYSLEGASSAEQGFYVWAGR